MVATLFDIYHLPFNLKLACAHGDMLCLDSPCLSEYLSCPRLELLNFILYKNQEKYDTN